MLDVESLEIPDIKIIRPKKHGDHRGFFSEVFNLRALEEAGVRFERSFVQDNHSFSADVGTVRGLHFQGPPFAQDKLVRVVRGRILDVAVDLRKSSPTFGKWVAAEISAEAWNQILVPVGFGHGVCTLEPNTELIYKVTNYYAPSHDFGMLWNDPDLGIPWPVKADEAKLSPKDAALPRFKDLELVFD